MKATGIVRRIDELGRVVVPKEIRKTLRIREGDPMEIFTNNDGSIVLKKYSPIGEMSTFAKQYAESIAQVSGNIVMITDREYVIAAAGGPKKELVGRRISRLLEETMSARENICTFRGQKGVTVVDGEEIGCGSQIVYSILGDGDILGSIVMLSKSEDNPLGENEQKIASIASIFLGKQTEN